MTIPTKTLSSGVKLSTLALGTWEMGGRKKPEAGYDASADIEAIRYAIGQGMTRIDTAEVYANGYTEEILGEALKPLDRNELFIQTKVLASNLRYADLIAACKGSLERLGLEYLDLYIVHKPNPAIEISETTRALDKLVSEGLIKHVAISNASTSTMKAYQDKLQNKLILNQVHYNLIFREPEEGGVLEYCQENDVFLEAWRPLEKGNLCKPGVGLLDKMSEKYGVSQAQIAIVWLLAQKNVITLFKSSKKDHIDENLRALQIEMDEEDIETLRTQFPIQLQRSNAVPLV